MKIAYNPKTAAAITDVTAKNDDIIFDLKAQQVWAKGVLMGVNSKSVDGFSVTSQDGFKYVSSKSIDVTTSGTLYATITTKDLYYNNMLHFKIVASYGNIMGVTYVDHYSRLSGIVVKLTAYNGNNIQGVSREPYNSQYLYLKITGPDMSKATKGTITVYSTVPLSSFALSSEDPGYVWYGVVGGVDGNVPINLEHIKNANNLYLPAYDVNNRNIQPNNTGIASLKAVKPFFVENKNYTIDSGTKGTYGDFLVLDTYSDLYGGSPNALLFDKNNLNIWHFKGDPNGSTWNTGKRLAYATELQSYLPLTGGTLTGSLIINPSAITSGTDSTEMLKIYSSTGYKSGLSISSMDNITIINAKPFGTGTTTNALQINTYNNSSTVNAIRITAAGLVGIGTTAPAYKLEVNGTGKFAELLTLSVASGTAPMSVTSTTLVLNLNVDLLDGHHFADIQVGGRNYYSLSKIVGIIGSITKDKTIHGYLGTVSGASNVRIQNIGMDGIISNWTVSFYIKAATACTAWVDLCDTAPSTLYNESGTINVTTSYVKHIFTFLNVNKYHDSSSGFNGFLDIYLNAANTIYVKDIKIERGTIATDWSLAPEDLVNDLALLDSSNFKNYFTEGSNISLTNDNGKCKITATNTWRTVNVNNASINQNTLNLCSGSYVTVTKGDNGKVTFDVNSTYANKWDKAYTWYKNITEEDDADTTINKWQEIVDFLKGIKEGDILNTLLNSKLAITQLDAKSDISTIKNNALYWVDTKGNASGMTNRPFNNSPFAMLSVTNYNTGTFSYRSRLAFNDLGEMAVAQCHSETEQNWKDTWYTVLTSKNSSIDTTSNTIKINDTSLKVSLSTHSHDSSYVKKSGDTMSGALNLNNNTWNKVGDDVAIGDCNMAGCLGIKGINAAPGLVFYDSSGTQLCKLVVNNNIFQRVLGSNTYTILDTSSTYVTNGVRVFSRTDIGTSPNYDNPGVNGLFEIRASSEVTGETGTRPISGYGPFLNLKTPDNIAMLLIAGYNGSLLYRAKLAGNVTMAGTSWLKLLDTSNSSVSGHTITINGAKTTWENTWRTIKINSSSIDQNELNLIAGTNVTLSRTNGNVTISSPNTWRSIYVNNTSSSLGSNAMTIANGTNTTATLANNNTVKINLNSALTGITSISGGANDYWRINFTNYSSDNGALEIATADNGNEPIYVRQYKYGDSSTAFGTVVRTLTLLDGSGNTTLPGTLTTTQVKTSGGIIHTGLYNTLYNKSTQTTADAKNKEALAYANNFILLGGGETLQMNTVTKTGIINKTITSLTISESWSKIADISGNTTLTSNGTYIVQAIMDNVYYSGVMSWYTGTPSANNTDEIVLHRGGGGYANTIYLRTEEVLNDKMYLEISANSELKSKTVYFYFQQIC